MNFTKHVVAMVIAYAMLTCTAYAEEAKDIPTMEASAGISVSVVEKDSTVIIDNSDMLVKIVRYINDVETIIYQGPLGEYGESLCDDIDFSSIDFAVIFNWDDPDDIIYVVPITETNETDRVIDVEENHQQMFSLTPQVVEPSLNIQSEFYINNFEIAENLASQNINVNDTLSAQYTIYNSATQEQSVQLMLCLYSQDGRMLDVATISDTVEPNSTKVIEKSLTVGPNITSCYAKVFLWNGFDTLRPLHNTLEIGTERESVEVVNAIVNCMTGEEYNLVTTVENMPSNDEGIYTITYNPSKLEIVDLCSLTYKKEIDAGLISGTNITILSVDEENGKIVFKNPNTNNSNASKVLNSIKFRSLVSSEQTVITIE